MRDAGSGQDAEPSRTCWPRRAAGDEAAFAELWRWLHPPLARWLAVVASGDVDDIESEVWISIARNLRLVPG